jgi:hypothetical protein
MGHYKSNCPGKKGNNDGYNTNGERQELDVTLTTMHVSLAVVKQEIDPMWILCNSESTVDIFKNKSLLVNIRKTKRPI